MTIFLFSIVAYLIGLGSMVGFFWFTQFYLHDLTTASDTSSIATNALLFLLFPLQHSIQVRPAIKAWIARKTHPLLERPLYVAVSGAVLWLIIARWDRFGPDLYRFETTWPFDVLFYGSLVFIVITTVALNHSRMFGLKHGMAALRQEQLEKNGLVTEGIYGRVRHPLTTLLIVCLWSHPALTASGLQWNLLFTAYALIGTYFEERDLIKRHGEAYRDYRKRVPAFVPFV